MNDARISNFGRRRLAHELWEILTVGSPMKYGSHPGILADIHARITERLELDRMPSVLLEPKLCELETLHYVLFFVIILHQPSLDARLHCEWWFEKWSLLVICRGVLFA